MALKSDGCVYVCVQELILSGNEIKQMGAIAVTESVSNKDNLRLLDLNGLFFVLKMKFHYIGIVHRPQSDGF